VGSVCLVKRFRAKKCALVANVSLMTKKLKLRCGSDWNNSRNTSMLQVLTHCYSDGTSVSMLVEDMSRNKCFSQVQISHVWRFISICDLFGASSSYIQTTFIWSERRNSQSELCFPSRDSNGQFSNHKSKLLPLKSAWWLCPLCGSIRFVTRKWSALLTDGGSVDVPKQAELELAAAARIS
jgi:hypothetical protein